jgi:hypothetical protein
VIWTRIIDPSRTPEHWTELIRPGQFAVFVFDAATHVARDRDCKPFDSDQVSLALCAGLAEAEAFAKELVGRMPALVCEIYDHEGKSKEPTRVIYNPAVRHKYEGLRYSRRQTLWASLVFACGVAFVVHDFMLDLTWIWGYVIGLKLMTVGGFRLGQGLVGWYEHRAESH